MSKVLGRIREYVLEILSNNLSSNERRKDTVKTNSPASWHQHCNSFIHANDLIRYLKCEYDYVQLNEPRSCSNHGITDGDSSGIDGETMRRNQNTKEERRFSLLAHIAKARLQNKKPTLSCSALCIAARSCSFEEVIVPLLEELTRERDHRKLELLTAEMKSLQVHQTTTTTGAGAGASTNTASTCNAAGGGDGHDVGEEDKLDLSARMMTSVQRLTEYAVKCAFEPFSHLPFNLYFSRADVVAEANEEKIKQALDFFLERLYAHPLNTISVNVGEGSADSGTSPLGVLLRCHQPNIALHFISKCSELCEESTSKRRRNSVDIGNTQSRPRHEFVDTRCAVGGENKCVPLCLHAWNADATDCNGNVLDTFLLAPSYLIQLLQNPRISREGSEVDEDLAVALIDKLIAIGCDLNAIAVLKAACTGDLFTWEGSTRRRWFVSLVIITHLVRRGARLCCEESTRRRASHTCKYYSVYSPLANVMVQCVNGDRKKVCRDATTLEHTKTAPGSSSLPQSDGRQRSENREYLGEETVSKLSAEKSGWCQDTGLRGLLGAVAKKCSSVASIVEGLTTHAVAPPCFCPEFITRTFQLSKVLGEFFISQLFAHGFSGYFVSYAHIHTAGGLTGRGGLMKENEAAMRTNLSPLAHLALRLFALPGNEEVASAWLSAVLDQSGADPCALYDEVVRSQGTSCTAINTSARVSVAHISHLLAALKPHMPYF